MVTLKDVAKKANVSVATVSCCLSGAKNVKPETKLRVMQAVDELNYIPNAAARELRRTASNKIGLVLPDLIDPYYNGILRGILNRIHSEDCIFSIAFTAQNPKEECKKIDELINANVAGLLIVTCQPENTAFFQTRIAKFGIPAVFIHQKPLIDANFIGFDSYSVMRRFTDELLVKGYTDIALIMGTRSFFSEEECLRGVRDAYLDRSLQFPAENIYASNMTKENAFRSAMHACHDRIPHAILSTSSQMTLGIKEALDLSGIRVPQDTVVATLGVESWNATNRLDGVLYSRCSADSLGSGAADLLLSRIRSETPCKSISISYTDNIRFEELDILPRTCHETPAASNLPKIRVMAFDSPSVRALEMLSNCYGKQKHIEFDFHYIRLAKLIPLIVTNSKKENPDYDVVFFDTPWTDYLASIDAFEDLTPLMESQRLGQLDFYPNFLNNGRSKEKQIGLPIICGTQVMFYRKDLFEKPAVMRAYKEKYDATLRPPRTWKEYNQIASFFTRSVNPASPTAYGTAIPCRPNEYLIPELMIRLWGKGAKLWNSAFHPTLLTSQVQQAYQSLLDALAYIPGSPFATDAMNAISSFCSGDVAMMIAFTDYAGQIRDSLDNRIISNIGYAPIPGHCTMQAGRNLGIFRNANYKEEIYDYFKWVFQSSTSSYYTILGGQTCIRQPYENSEIIGQYPWMELTKRPAEHLFSRSVPVRRGAKSMIPINRFETVLCDVLRRVVSNEMTLQASLQIAQVEMEALFSEYGV